MTKAKRQKTSAPLQQIPISCWAKALDFLVYSEVHQMLLVSKMFAKEVCKEVSTLNILEPHEMDVVSRNKLGNSVREVNIYSLFAERRTLTAPHNPLELRGVDVIVPFLQSLPRLERAAIGGRFIYERYMPQRDVLSLSEYRYYKSGLVDQDKFDRLLYSFCGAFKVRALSSKLKLDIFHPFRRPHVYMGDNCTVCRSICATFPLETVMALRCTLDLDPDVNDFESTTCLSQGTFCRIIKERTSISEISDLTKEMLSDVISYAVVYCDLSDGDENLAEQIDRIGLSDGIYTEIYWITNAGFRAIQALIDFGCEPKKMTCYDLCHALSVCSSDLLLKSSFDRLLGMGFPVDHADFISTIDVEEHPIIRQILDETLGEAEY